MYETKGQARLQIGCFTIVTPRSLFYIHPVAATSCLQAKKIYNPPQPSLLGNGEQNSVTCPQISHMFSFSLQVLSRALCNTWPTFVSDLDLLRNGLRTSLAVDRGSTTRSVIPGFDYFSCNKTGVKPLLLQWDRGLNTSCNENRVQPPLMQWDRGSTISQVRRPIFLW